MRLVFASDTHGLHDVLAVPDGDVFIHCGDLTNTGELSEIREVGKWLRRLPHRHKIVIAGNHDRAFEDEPETAQELVGAGAGVIYLQDAEVNIDGVKFYGSPWQPWFLDWAFNLQRGAEIARKWNLIPDGTDVLVTHGPPMTILDYANGQHLGCADLWKRVSEVGPKIHAFGHIHESSGEEDRDGTKFVNAAICDGEYFPVNPARVVDI
jgi:Icc-related predicted phosphoesterase